MQLVQIVAVLAAGIDAVCYTRNAAAKQQQVKTLKQNTAFLPLNNKYHCKPTWQAH